MAGQLTGGDGHFSLMQTEFLLVETLESSLLSYASHYDTRIDGRTIVHYCFMVNMPAA